MIPPKISVVIPVYNVADYIEKCIQSVLAQTFTDIEIIIVNDGSTDNSMQKIEHLIKKNPLIKVIHQNNQGLSAARNSAMKIAKGDYLTFVDSDDAIAPNFCEMTYQNAKKHQADIVIVDNRETVKFAKDDFIRKIKNEKTRLKLCLFGKISWVAWGKLYKRELFKNRAFPVGRLYEDSILIPRIIVEAKKIFITNSTKYSYNFRVGSIINQPVKMQDKIFVWRSCLELARKYNISRFDQQLFLSLQFRHLKLTKTMGYWRVYKLAKNFGFHFFFLIYFSLQTYSFFNRCIRKILRIKY
jgi:glycosyltransferase involved in cell wall biosynthesis